MNLLCPKPSSKFSPPVVHFNQPVRCELCVIETGDFRLLSARQVLCPMRAPVASRYLLSCCAWGE